MSIHIVISADSFTRVKRIMRYVKGSAYFGLFYSSSEMNEITEYYEYLTVIEVQRLMRGRAQVARCKNAVMVTIMVR